MRRRTYGAGMNIVRLFQELSKSTIIDDDIVQVKLLQTLERLHLCGNWMHAYLGKES